MNKQVKYYSFSAKRASFELQEIHTFKVRGFPAGGRRNKFLGGLILGPPI